MDETFGGAWCVSRAVELGSSGWVVVVGIVLGGLEQIGYGTNKQFSQPPAAHTLRFLRIADSQFGVAT
jgi:hypothetical protein